MGVGEGDGCGVGKGDGCAVDVAAVATSVAAESSLTSVAVICIVVLACMVDVDLDPSIACGVAVDVEPKSKSAVVAVALALAPPTLVGAAAVLSVGGNTAVAGGVVVCTAPDPPDGRHSHAQRAASSFDALCARHAASLSTKLQPTVVTAAIWQHKNSTSNIDIFDN